MYSLLTNVVRLNMSYQKKNTHLISALVLCCNLVHLIFLFARNNACKYESTKSSLTKVL